MNEQEDLEVPTDNDELYEGDEPCEEM